MRSSSTPPATSPLPQLVRDFLAESPLDFVEVSKRNVKHLHDAQGGVSPGGLATLVDCTIGARKAIEKRKLEKEESVRLS